MLISGVVPYESSLKRVCSNPIDFLDGVVLPGQSDTVDDAIETLFSENRFEHCHGRTLRNSQRLRCKVGNLLELDRQ